MYFTHLNSLMLDELWAAKLMADIKRFKNRMCFPWYNHGAVTCSSNKDFSRKSRAVTDFNNNQICLCLSLDVFHSASFGILESTLGFHELNKFNNFNPDSYLSNFMIIFIKVLMSNYRFCKNKCTYFWWVRLMEPLEGCEQFIEPSGMRLGPWSTKTIQVLT